MPATFGDDANVERWRSIWKNARGVMACDEERLDRAVRDQLALLQYAELRRQIPFLYSAITVISIAAGVGAVGDFPFFLQVVAPVSVISLCLYRLFVWIRRPARSDDPEGARRHLRGTVLAAIGLCGLAALWSVTAYFETNIAYRAFVSVFTLLSTFAVAYCLSAYKKAALYALIVGTVPITVLLLISGERLFTAMGVCALVLELLQVRLLSDRHRQAITTLELQLRMRQLADTDGLTGLANRRAFIATSEAQMSDRMPFRLALLDLDGFKQVNDRLGHMAGDALLCSVANRLTLVSGTHALVARLGGDEFALLFLAGTDESLVRHLAREAIAAVAEPHALEAGTVALTASLGLAQFPADGGDATTLLAAADRALYAAKNGGRATMRVSADELATTRAA